MKYLFYLILFLSANIGLSKSIIGRVDNQPPFYYKKNRDWEGLVVDLYYALANEAGIKLKLEEMSLSLTLKSIKTRPIMTGQISQTKNRKKDIYYIGPHSLERINLLINKNYKNYPIKNLNDLVNLSKKTKKLIAYYPDIHYSDEFNSRIRIDKKFKNHFKKFPQKTPLIEKLYKNKILGFFEKSSTAKYLINNPNYKKKIIIYHNYIINQIPIYFGLSKTINISTYKKILEANKRLLKRGVYTKIFKKWQKKKFKK